MSLPEIKTLKDTLKDEMRAKSISIAKLSELTGVSPHHIHALIESDFANLPAAPYVRGYLEKISEVLEVDFEVLWRRYEKELTIRRSGKDDTLPQNRYAIRTIKKETLWISALIIVVLIVIIPTLVDFFGKPSLEVSSPTQETEIATSAQLAITGLVKNPNDRVFINDTEITVGSDGTFSIDEQLENGANTFIISARRFLGRTTTITRNVFYKPDAQTMLNQLENASSSQKATTSTSTKEN